MLEFLSRRILCLLLVALFTVPFVGCGGPGGDEEPKSILGPAPEQAMIDLKAMLELMEKEKQPMPKGVQDLSAYGPGFPAAEVFLQNGAIVYAWGSKISQDAEAATTVIAYESKTPTEGGLVMMQDGSTKTMTADEFKAAKVAGKKK